jgi:hypothetical protein
MEKPNRQLADVQIEVEQLAEQCFQVNRRIGSRIVKTGSTLSLF